MELCSHSRKKDDILHLIFQHKNNYTPLEFELSALLDKYMLVNIDEVQDHRVKLKWHIIKSIITSISGYNSHVIKTGRIRDYESYSDLLIEEED